MTSPFPWTHGVGPGSLFAADGSAVADCYTFLHVDDFEAIPGLTAELESARAYIARVQGAAVPFALNSTEAGALSPTRRRDGSPAAEILLRQTLCRCMADLAFAQSQYQAACDRASEATMRAQRLENDLAAALGVLREARPAVQFAESGAPRLSPSPKWWRDLGGRIDTLLAAHKEVQG